MLESTNSKHLYVVSSLHTVPRATENVKNQIWDIIEVRLMVIEALAKTLGKGAFFNDNADAELAESANYIIENHDLATIRTTVMELLYKGNSALGSYEFYTMIELFKRLREKKKKFTFKETEPVNRDHITYYLREVTDKINDEENMPDYDVLGELAKNAFAIMLELRDRDIIDNVEHHGEENNILFIGSAHPLKTLSQSSLTSSRVEVVGEKKEIVIAGELPDSLRKSFGKISPKTKTEKPVKQDIKFL